MKKNLIFAGALLAALGAINYATAADSSNEAKEAQAIQNAKLSLLDAAKAAEAKVGGKATSVGIAEVGGKAVYHVEIIGADNTPQDLAVDAETGEVTKMAANAADGDGGSENDDQD